MTEEQGRSARKRKLIMEAATAAFLQQGYKGTTMDEVAAEASVSKQTVYKHFSDKKSLFSAIVADTSSRVDENLKEATLALIDTEDLEPGLRHVARQLISFILQPQVVQLRRLIIAEAGRFPEIGRAYWEQGFDKGLRTLGSALEKLVQRGMLQTDDPLLAAHQLAGLCLWVPVNRVMFCGEEGLFSQTELDRYADEAVRVFLAAHASIRATP